MTSTEPERAETPDTGADREQDPAVEDLVLQIEQAYTHPTATARYLAHFLETAKNRDDSIIYDADPATPATVQQVIAGLRALNLTHVACLYPVEHDYYHWTLARRMCRLNAPTRAHLCKSIIMENTRCPHNSIDDPAFSKYYCVIVQYTAKLNTQKLFNFGRDLKQRSISKKNYNFRLVDPEISEQLTGYGTGGVSPFGMKSNVPIILAEAITKLDPPVFWLGAGHIDWKVAVPASDFVATTGCYVTDLES
ncbi:rho guanine nucleotide exchange factor [Allomyces macrogynus ATCC 38327]|uniref:Rho guanine nucleotide exchange factor n=1 Tax=Allomyces macrogynus (strain ATCC 38327) TaxID=578462 RepID=A0A0L0SJA5_ALLM3|nr:rho guanine nucleotide exchange factor [Allomyces macrogynus ATCC 38327]|eukprot:KNE62576.1 rho guanine nucleotide exchange factor [Allomyces macrogynus ATCC 38327]